MHSSETSSRVRNNIESTFNKTEKDIICLAVMKVNSKKDKMLKLYSFLLY